MQFFLTQNKLTKSCLNLQPDLYTIYKLIVRSSGHYYIGVTGDFYHRIDNHGHHIMGLVTSGGERHYKSDLPFHFIAERELNISTDGLVSGWVIERQIRAGIDVQVLAVIHGKGNAYYLEAKMINDAKQDPLCSNNH